jgi:hypothetical protein
LEKTKKQQQKKLFFSLFIDALPWMMLDGRPAVVAERFECTNKCR